MTFKMKMNSCPTLTGGFNVHLFIIDEMTQANQNWILSIELTQAFFKSQFI